MKRSYRDNKPRFHKHRQGKMLLPHNQLSGLFFTVNPRQEPRAQREAQLYLSSLTRDLEAAHEAFVGGTSGRAPRDERSSAEDSVTAPLRVAVEPAGGRAGGMQRAGPARQPLQRRQATARGERRQPKRQ